VIKRGEEEMTKEREKIIKQIQDWSNNVNWDLVNPYAMDNLINSLKEGKVPVKYLGRLKSKELKTEATLR